MKLFIDMDNTITNFNKAVEQLNQTQGLREDANPEEKQRMYDAIEKSGEKFWANMEWLPDGKQLWDAVKQYNPILLSSPGKFLYAPSGKKIWVDNNLPGTPLYLSTNKDRYAQIDAILIDDDVNNIDAWQTRGGSAILHTTASETIKKLNDLCDEKPYLKIADIETQIIDWLKKRRIEEPTSKSLIPQIKKETKDVKIKHPGLFRRDLERIINYTGSKIKDPKKHGLIQDLLGISNDLRQDYVLTKGTQNLILDKTMNFGDPLELPQHLKRLFEQTHALRPLATALRLIAFKIPNAREQ